MSLFFALITGETAAIAEPPQMPVPALIRLDNFQSNPSHLPIKYPPPKLVRRVKNIIEMDMLPTFKIVPILSDAPSKTIENFKTRFVVKFKPFSKVCLDFNSGLRRIPINNAITESPINEMDTTDSID